MRVRGADTPSLPLMATEGKRTAHLVEPIPLIKPAKPNVTSFVQLRPPNMRNEGSPDVRKVRSGAALGKQSSLGKPR